MQASVNIEVSRGPNENNLSVLRRFTKRVQQAGVLPRVRSKRYSEREKSENVKRAKTLEYLRKKEVAAELIKLGKINEISKFSRSRRR
ncbi:MAG: 30S ribosomal protein S21 [Candidatus Zambryskibacteria bacterium]|nr:30S ribosomal protein S21 [Candidatus Zambryskibacteria bacterium]